MEYTAQQEVTTKITEKKGVIIHTQQQTTPSVT